MERWSAIARQSRKCEGDVKMRRKCRVRDGVVGLGNRDGLAEDHRV